MPNPRLIVRTGNALIDRQNREMVSGSATYVAEVKVTSSAGPVIKSIPHMLGRAPNGWRVVRGNPSAVSEANAGKFTRDYADLQFSVAGTWQIEFL